jgi:hypothetical protein
VINARVVLYPDDVAATVVVTPSPPRLPVAVYVTFQASSAWPPRVAMTPMFELVRVRLPRLRDAVTTLPVIVKAGDASVMFVDVALFVQDV